MESLKNQVLENLNQFKSNFINASKDYAIYEYDRLSKLTEQDVIDQRGYTDYSFKKYPNGVRRHSKASFAYWRKVSSIIYSGLDIFVDKEVKKANTHFEMSVVKILDKASKKGLDLSKAVVKDFHFSLGNISLTMTDGIKSVFVYTIVAYGDIQKPHYRFLIK